MLRLCCRWKHVIALGSHDLRSFVRHRQVTKGLPRAHPWSFGRDYFRFVLRFVLHYGRTRFSGEAGPQKFDASCLPTFELLPGDYGSVGAG